MIMKQNTRFKKVCLFVLHLLLKKKSMFTRRLGGDERSLCSGAVSSGLAETGTPTGGSDCTAGRDTVLLSQTCPSLMTSPETPRKKTKDLCAGPEAGTPWLFRNILIFLKDWAVSWLLKNRSWNQVKWTEAGRKSAPLVSALSGILEGRAFSGSQGSSLSSPCLPGRSPDAPRVLLLLWLRNWVSGFRKTENLYTGPALVVCPTPIKGVKSDFSGHPALNMAGFKTDGCGGQTQNPDRATYVD